MIKNWMVKLLVLLAAFEIVLNCNELFFDILYMYLIRSFEIIWIYLFYIEEKQNKLQFIQKYIQNQKLLGWKKLLDEVMPNQIFIVKKKYSSDTIRKKKCQTSLSKENPNHTFDQKETNHIQMKDLSLKYEVCFANKSILSSFQIDSCPRQEDDANQNIRENKKKDQ